MYLEHGGRVRPESSSQMCRWWSALAQKMNATQSQVSSAGWCAVEVAAMRMAQREIAFYRRLLAMERTGLEMWSWLHTQSKACECKERRLEPESGRKFKAYQDQPVVWAAHWGVRGAHLCVRCD